ncbi:hypothetical protein AG1IA_04806 [Rhizoctonia solani AG-1 IA]|uniref:Uncharacterized protein n=1 Tax=Thanatephorus cucumeris (strain AG1-IA) TaxID=983506 RepID=L8WWJ9_THACA|nr:hypothetical protein AG1IA_04806 [Rhizoctonia solani AG-1 IA]
MRSRVPLGMTSSSTCPRPPRFVSRQPARYLAQNAR